MPFGYVLGLLGVGIVIGFAVFKYSSTYERNTSPAVANLTANPPVQTAAVLDVAKQFLCPCGNCNDQLDVCDCEHKNGALEVKAFIAEQFRLGHKKPHITEMVMQRFAPKKSASAPLFEFDQPVR